MKKKQDLKDWKVVGYYDTLEEYYAKHPEKAPPKK